MQQTTTKRDAAGQIGLAIGVILIFWLFFVMQAINWAVVSETAATTGQMSARSIVGYSALAAGGFAVYCWIYRRRAQRIDRYRAVFDTWALATLFVMFMLPIRFIPPLQSAELTTILQTVQLFAIGLFLTVLHLVAEHRRADWRDAANAGWLPWLVAPIIMVWWWQIGVFGSVTETIASILIGLLFGYAVGVLVGQFLLPAIEAESHGIGWDMWLMGWAVGGVLLIMGSAFGTEGQLFYLALLLPFVGWVGVGLMRVGLAPESPHPVLGRLIGLVTAAVLVSADVDELSLLYLLDLNEHFPQLFTAVGISVLLSLIIAGLLWLFYRQLPHLRPGIWVKIATVLVWGGVLAQLAAKTNAGFYGDQLFVVMSQQADLSQAEAIDDVSERRAYIYSTLVDHAEQSQTSIRAWLDLFGIDYQPYYLVNGIAVRGGFLTRLYLSNASGVDRVIPDPVLRPLPQPLTAYVATTDTAETPPDRLPWGIRATEADRVWDELGVRGSGIVIGQSDSGVEWDHPEFLDSYRGRIGGHDYHWLDPWGDSAEPYDISGHGTHTLGTIVGNNVGVAPDATWFGCANLVRNIGSASLYLDCMQFMLAPYPHNGDPFIDGETNFAADVLNNSWGCPPFEGCDPTVLQAGVEALRSAGIFVVVSAGNEGEGGCGSVSSPLALYDAAFSVGAYSESGQLATFSSRGPVTVDGSSRTKPDIIAPGVDVNSAWIGHSYQPNQGTSMAGPHVAGVVALIWSANPTLRGNINSTELILIESAEPFDYAQHGTPLCGDEMTTPDNAVGYGRVNAYNAVQMALSWRR